MKLRKQMAAAVLAAAALSLSLPLSQAQGTPSPDHMLGLTAEQRMEDYKYLWSVPKDSQDEYIVVPVCPDRNPDGAAAWTFKALALGADAVINIRYGSSSVMQGAAEVIAYGTAVKYR